MNAGFWNNNYPIGTKVRYYSIIGEPEYIETETRSEAWEFPSGEPVVQVEGKSGCVSLRTIEPLEIVSLKEELLNKVAALETYCQVLKSCVEELTDQGFDWENVTSTQKHHIEQMIADRSKEIIRASFADLMEAI